MQNDKAEKLLLSWCDYLLRQQITDKKDEHYGGFRCEACGHIHGRADNAVYPLVCAYALTDDKRYLDGAKRLLHFRRLLTHAGGAVQNDFSSEWKGITVFSAINLYKSFHHFGEKLPADFRSELEALFAASANWVYQNVKKGFRANINYFCAAAAVNAMAGEYFRNNDYRLRAKELLNYCLSLFTTNGLLCGEGQPHDQRTDNGCAPIDFGYEIEESLPCLADAAMILNDGGTLEVLREHARKMLYFMLPDGGWDNTFGVRNNKWTYYGSRTADGCIGLFTAFAAKDDVFAEVARRTLDLLSACTHDGALYGGRQYRKYGQPPCVHHTFCHAAALADAIRLGMPDQKQMALPCDRPGTWVKHYHEINTYKLSVGPWLADVTAYDYATYTFSRGAAHASGGSLSLLYHRSLGIIIAGSVLAYELTEPNNMQQPRGVLHRSLLPRAELEKDGAVYATCADGGASISVYQYGDAVSVSVQARFCEVKERKAADESLTVSFRYLFSDDRVTVTTKLNQKRDGVRFVLPIVKNSATIATQAPYERRDVFFLTGGFGADEYTFPLTEQEITIEIGG